MNYIFEPTNCYFLNVNIANQQLKIPYYGNVDNIKDEDVINILTDYFCQISIHTNPDEVIFYYNGTHTKCIGSKVKFPYVFAFSNIHPDFIRPINSSPTIITDKIIIALIIKYFVD